MVLLHLLYQLRQQQPLTLAAIHINHQLHLDANVWEQRCRQRCQEWDIPFISHRVKVDPQGEGPESAAREARYGVFLQLLEEGDLLLLAHHQDDQAETLLLRLMRGCGVQGAAAIPEQRPLGRGWLARPLLDSSRGQITHYAQQQQLSWIEDPSNSDHRFDRNYIRHQLMPQLQQRRPGVAAVLARSTHHFGEAAQLLAQLASEDLQRLSSDGATLDCTLLAAMDEARSRNLLRYWLAQRQLTVPSSAHLHCILHEVVGARQDGTPLVHWDGGEVRRHAGRLYGLLPLAPPPTETVVSWLGERELLLPEGIGRLRFTPVIGQGISMTVMDPAAGITIRWRQGGERIRLMGKKHHQGLKPLLQQAGIPPWERLRLPLIYLQQQLIQVMMIGISAEVGTAAGEDGMVVEWLPITAEVKENH